MLESGASRFDFAVTVSIIGILASVMLYSLNRTQKQIEAAMLDTEVTNLRWELRAEWAHRNVTGRSLASREIDNANPMRLLSERPQNYLGEHAGVPQYAQSIWYFDTSDKRLVYVFSDGRQARYRLANTASLGRASPGAIGGMDLVPDSLDRQ